MRLTLVNGFFLPVPPVSGGSTEKTWHTLAQHFAARGHAVTSFSRRWPGQPDDETVDGIRHRRLPGHEHHPKLPRNLWQDFWWSCRVARELPRADIVICHAVSLPLWLGRLQPAAGRVVLMTGRMPKGQYRYYSRLARILAPSEVVRDRVVREQPALAPLIRTTGYPIAWSLLSGADGVLPPRPPPDPAAPICLGYVGRLHREKGLLLLAAALHLLRRQTDLPPWQFLLCGPGDTASGGSGGGFRDQLLGELSRAVPLSHLQVLEPQYRERTLADIYRRIDVFCYPSLAAGGETFGVAVAEAMAAGALPVVSALPCFGGLVQDGGNGLVFDHTAPDPAAALAAVLRRALLDAALRRTLATRAQAEVRRLDFPLFADQLLGDFAALTAIDPSRPPA